MKKRLLTIGLSLAMVLSTTSVAFAAPKTPLHTINGGGTIFYPGTDENGEVIPNAFTESYGFNIRLISATDAVGNATGTMQFSWHYSSGDLQYYAHAEKQYIVHAKITYVKFADDNEVWAGGVVTSSNVDKATPWLVPPGDLNDPLIVVDENGYTPADPIVGSTFHIRIQDNGANDSLGYLIWCPTMDLHVHDNYIAYLYNGETWVHETLTELTNGNITIK